MTDKLLNEKFASGFNEYCIAQGLDSVKLLGTYDTLTKEAIPNAESLVHREPPKGRVLGPMVGGALGLSGGIGIAPLVAAIMSIDSLNKERASAKEEGRDAKPWRAGLGGAAKGLIGTPLALGAGGALAGLGIGGTADLMKYLAANKPGQL